MSISGHIARPGVYEVEYGYPLAKFLYEDCGGMVDGRKVKALVPGGISTKVLTGAEVENVTFDHQSLTTPRARRWDRAAWWRSPKARAWCVCCR